MSNVSRCPPWFAEIVERENRKLREFMQREMRQAGARGKKEAPGCLKTGRNDHQGSLPHQKMKQQHDTK
jgi:hypothetical protein